MRVKLDCEISLPDSLVSDLMREFGLFTESGKVIIGRSQYKAAERIVTEYLINNRVQERADALDRMFNARLQSIVSLMGGMNAGGTINKMVPPVNSVPVQKQEMPAESVPETSSDGQAVDISRKKMDKLKKISFG